MSDLGYNVMPPDEAPAVVVPKQLPLSVEEVLAVDDLVHRTGQQS